jgi:hypothetical protein
MGETTEFWGGDYVQTDRFKRKGYELDTCDSGMGSAWLLLAVLNRKVLITGYLATN